MGFSPLIHFIRDAKTKMAEGEDRQTPGAENPSWSLVNHLTNRYL
jgi:hypothetical protein